MINTLVFTLIFVTHAYAQQVQLDGSTLLPEDKIEVVYPDSKTTSQAGCNDCVEEDMRRTDSNLVQNQYAFLREMKAALIENSEEVFQNRRNKYLIIGDRDQPNTLLIIKNRSEIKTTETAYNSYDAESKFAKKFQKKPGMIAATAGIFYAFIVNADDFENFTMNDASKTLAKSLINDLARKAKGLSVDIGSNEKAIFAPTTVTSPIVGAKRNRLQDAAISILASEALISNRSIRRNLSVLPVVRSHYTGIRLEYRNKTPQKSCGQPYGGMTRAEVCIQEATRGN